MDNPRKFDNLLLPLSIQSTRRNLNEYKTTAVFGFQTLVCFSVNQVSESIIKEIWILPFFWL